MTPTRFRELPLGPIAPRGRPRVAIPPTDEILLVQEGAIDDNRLSRCYGYLAARLRRLSEFLGFPAMGLLLGASATLSAPLPAAVPAAALALGAPSVAA